MFVFCHADLQKDDTVCNYTVQTFIHVCLVIIERTLCTYIFYMVTDTIIEKTFSLSKTRFLTAAGFSTIS